MRNIFSKLMIEIKNELKYLYIKYLNKSKYEKFIENEYKKRTKKTLNLVKPESFTEKMQYSKLYRNTSLKTRLTDKYEVREWVSEKIGSEYLIPMLGVWEQYQDIEFEKLPSKFVLKTNHSSGWNLVVKDKLLINHAIQKIRFNRWLKKDFAFAGDLQLHYNSIEPKIIAEQFINDRNGNLYDYRFLCFHDKVEYIWVDFYEDGNHFSNIYDVNWNLQNWNFVPMKNYYTPINKPINFEKMLEVAKELSQGFSHVRVDLYNIEGKIYFGEMTFTSTGGYRLLSPDSYDLYLGKKWDINSTDSEI